MITIKEANISFKNGSYSEAIKKYNEIITRNPEFEKILNTNLYLAKKKCSQHIEKTKTTNTNDRKLIEKILARPPQKKTHQPRKLSQRRRRHKIRQLQYKNYTLSAFLP